MTTHHTPGPWYASPHISSAKGTIDVGGDEGANVALVLTGDNNVGPDRTAYANARLIASAPELLASLEALGIDFISDEDRINTVRAAIAKATGAAA